MRVEARKGSAVRNMALIGIEAFMVCHMQDVTRSVDGKWGAVAVPAVTERH